jgi:hypothetical protein
LFPKEVLVMAATSRDAAKIFYRTYNRSKDLIGNFAQESGSRFEDLRRWVPSHPTAVAVSASAAVSVGILGFLLGRRRQAPQTVTEKAFASAARMPELDIAPFFKFLKLWMLYRVATKD